MKNLFATSIILLGIAPPIFADNDLWESKGPHVRIKRNDQDGSQVIFQRSPDDRTLVKTTKDENLRIKMKATYTRNPKGFLTTGRIHDGQGNLIYRVKYGYDRKTGQLIAEDMFDARVRRTYPDVRDSNGQLKEMPIRRVYYFYDADGNQSKAISLVPNKGKTAEEVFKKKELRHFQKEENFDPNSTTNPLRNNPFEKGRQNQ